jgi:phosphatidylglycerol---prolipoprotein diacylglyceryl transferase
MQQVLFTIPVFKSFFPPDGIPVYGFGAMLFVAFILVTLWGISRAKPIGMPAERFQDFTIWVFVSGLIGARLLYMIQYADRFHDHSIIGLILASFKIWEGGIIYYGSVIGGAIGYGLFYWFVKRRMNVSGWQLADAVAPLLALGLAIGRIGCYLNGCCGGQVVCEQCATIPLGAAHFPLLPAPARDELVTVQNFQTSTGFAIQSHGSRHEDPRTEVTVVEPDSPAYKAGLRPGDRVMKVDGKPNSILVDLLGSEERVQAAISGMKSAGGRVKSTTQGRTRVEFDTLPAYIQGQDAAISVAPGIELYPTDYLEELTYDWPRGKASLTLGVERDGKEIDLQPFTPRTVGLDPTQLYETVSMVLLILLLLAYYPYRRHDGQLLVLLMICYAVHRFINESLRIEPTIGLGLTLSQWGSVVIFVAAAGIEIYLWCVMPSRWKNNVPLKPTDTPALPPTASK